MQQKSGNAAYHGPAWDNGQEYANLKDGAITADIAKVAGLILKIETLSAPLADAVERGRFADKGVVEGAVALLLLRDEALTLSSNIATYASCALSVNGADGEAKQLLNQVESQRSALASALQPLHIWVSMADDGVMETFFSHQAASAERFNVERLRGERDHLLSLAEEKLIKSLEIHGPSAFGHLYDDISSLLRCQVDMPGQAPALGMAQAANLLRDPDIKVRRQVYAATNAAWQTQKEPCAAVLNNINGWRHEIYKRRSHKKPMHFLDPALRRGCIERSTLDAMLDAVRQHKAIGHKALALKAKLMEVPKLGPWDLFAPAPQPAGDTVESLMTFAEAIDLVSAAFSAIDPSMGEFVRFMQKSRWIEGSVGENKRPGAYCTKFLKSRTPRVYMTYAGNMDNVSTLAHELGHAFHSWLMRDLPLAQLSYPMTLAETASIFAETALNDHLLTKHKGNPAALLPILWGSAGDAEVFLLNIPARFTFEYEFNEMRQKQILTPDGMDQLMIKAWRLWYEDSLTEMNPLFWASKLHFHMAHLSFYNFPYTFGYLFSLGVYAQREALGADFFPRYKDLLRDTGRMTAEDLAAKYLSCDLASPDFWLCSLRLVEQKVDMLAALGIC